jgi:hypothetical protein
VKPAEAETARSRPDRTARAFELEPLLVGDATILAAVTTNANVFIPAQRHDTYAANSATVVPFTTALPILTLMTLICNFAAVPAQ